MIITNHRIDGVEYVSSPNQGGEISPKFIVMHYTAGYTAQSAINTLCNPDRKASAHIVLDTDGTITQLVDFHRKAWHAGKSAYKGHKWLNSKSIGIEIVNIGFLRLLGDKFQDSYGNVKTIEEIGVDVLEAPHARVGSGNFYWPIYPEAQLQALDVLTAKLIEEYNIIDIVSHEEIDLNGWKTDPGPAFPMQRYKNLLPMRDMDENQYQVTASTLNVRSGPGTEFDVIAAAALVHGDIIEVTDIRGDWGRIDGDGWIHMGYVRVI